VGNGDSDLLEAFWNARRGFVLVLRVVAAVVESGMVLRELRGKAGREIEDRRSWIEN
jgi:hypothetical protein